MPAAAIIPAVAAIGSAVVGADQAGKNRDAAQSAREQALGQFAGISAPSVEDQKLGLTQEQVVGGYDPMKEQALQQQQSELNNVNVDPRLKASQMAALQQVSGIAQNGFSDADKAALELIKRQTGQQDQAKQNQILQQMQERGQGGSGAELIARLKGAQVDADAMNQQALQQQVMAQQNRQAALQAQANMASGIRSQDYGQQADAARAQDVINQFNTNNSQNVANTNVGNQNLAQQQNLQQRQNVANTNVGLLNQQQMNNKGLLQQQFNNQMGIANARAGQQNSMANAQDSIGAQTAAMWGGIGQGVGTSAATILADKKKDTSTPTTATTGT